jgi:predicted nucleic acid-binding protein
MGKRGPHPVAPETLYIFAHQFYWDFRGLLDGRFRWGFDEKGYKQRTREIEKTDLSLTQEEIGCLERAVANEVRTGHLKKAERADRLRDLIDSDLVVKKDWLRRRASAEARRHLKIPGEPRVLKALLGARTADRVRIICKDAYVPMTIEVRPGLKTKIQMQNWPIASGSVLPRCLSQYAEQFIAAKNDPRYPRSKRPTNNNKQLWFLSRALAGAVFGLKTRTAINLVGSLRPEEMFHESRDGKPARRQRKRRLKS